MWLKFDSIDYRENLEGQSGKKYSAWVVSGTKKGFKGEPDQPYTKVLFENQTITVIERGITRPGQSVVQFFQKAAKPGDVFDIKSERDGKFWKWITITKLEDNNPTYTPLTDEEVQRIQAQQAMSRPQYQQPQYQNPASVMGSEVATPSYY